MREGFRILAAAGAGFLALATCAFAAEAPARGPLRTLESNPRYFTDGSGKAIYLAGAHNWNNFEDTGHRVAESAETPVFGYEAYLDFLVNRHLNFFRLWRWELPRWTDEEPPGLKRSAPHPWMRTGPGAAADGDARFDLTRFNQEYFNRLRSRVTAARDRGIYVSVMLFEGWGVQFTKDGWKYHPFNAANNVNGIDADADRDGRGIEFYTIQDSEMGRRVLQLQEAYLRKTIDTVNDLDNVLYEVCNEAGPYSTDWQYHVIRFVKQYESGRPARHPVGMTFQYAGESNEPLFNSPADWISPGRSAADEGYRADPPSQYRGKVIVNDTDHLWGHSGGDAIWAWKSFMRGLNVLFMDELTPSPTWHDSARMGMAQILDWSRKIDLAGMAPHDEIAFNHYCLAKPGVEYLTFQPSPGWIRLDLKAYPYAFQADWFNVDTGETIPAGRIRGGESTVFAPPFGAPAALHLKAAVPLPAQTDRPPAGGARTAHPPAIFRASEAIGPGALLNLYGGDMKPGETLIRLEGVNRELPVINADDEGSFVTTALPADLAPGVYTVRVRNAAGWSAPVAINAVIPQWLSETTAFRGLKVRLFGRNLDAAEFGGKTASELRLVSAGGKPVSVTPLETTPYALGFTIPDVPVGYYAVEARNMPNAAWVRFKASPLQIVEPSPDPFGLGVSWVRDFNWKNVQDVREFGAKGDGATDDTRAIARGIDAVADAGGGILRFPEGTYPYTGIGLRAGVIIAGDPKNPTLLHYIGAGGMAITAVGDGLAQGRIGISSLRFTVDASRLREDMRLIYLGAYSGGRDKATLTRLFVHNCTIDMPLDNPRIEESIHIGSAGQVLVAGNHVRAARGEVWDTSVSSVAIRDNTFDYSKGFVETMASQAIVENNRLTGHIVPAVTGQSDLHGMFSTPATGKLQHHQYWADNVVEGMETARQSHDGESFTSDSTNGFIAARVVRVEGRKLALAPDCVAPIDPFRITWDHEWQAVIVAGRGVGQMRAITAHVGDSEIEVDREWDVAPDAGSKVAITRMTEDVVATNNTVRNNQIGMQLWRNGYDIVISDNRSLSTSGVNTVAEFLDKREPLFRPCSYKPVFFPVIRRNVVTGSSSGSWLENNSTQIAIRAGDEASKLAGRPAAYGTLSYGVEIRDNRIDQAEPRGDAIVVEGRQVREGRQIVGTLVDGNRISNAANGILIIGPTVYYTTIRDGEYGRVRNTAVDQGSTGTVILKRQGTVASPQPVLPRAAGSPHR